MALELTGFRVIFVFVPWQWPPEERTEKEKARLAMKWFNEWKKNQVF